MNANRHTLILTADAGLGHRSAAHFYVFANRFWCVCGAGRSEYRALDERQIAEYALGFLEMIQDGFRKHRRGQLDVSLSAGDSTKPATRFYIPRAASED